MYGVLLSVLSRALFREGFVQGHEGDLDASLYPYDNYHASVTPLGHHVPLAEFFNPSRDS